MPLTPNRRVPDDRATRHAEAGLARLARPDGAFAMVALDQRGSLRTMLASASGRNDVDVGDGELTAFKVAAARALSPHASAVLLDLEYGLWPVLESRAVAPGCAVIVAADRLTQPPGGPVESTDVDEAVLADDRIGVAAAAFKLLVIRRPDEGDGGGAHRERIVRSFLDHCHDRGRPAIVEAIVRVADGASMPADHARLVIEAAEEIGRLGPDLYKAEVPTLGRGSDVEIVEASQRLTDTIPCPWVVLSNGVESGRFDDAAIAACRGGASGFLAGRAIWSESIRAANVEEHLSSVAAPRLERLARRVDDAVANIQAVR
jgi:sulfofructosephosphate aldolase